MGLRGISKNVIAYSEIENIYKVTKIKRNDKIYDGHRRYYLYLKDKTVIEIRSAFIIHEFGDKGIPMLLNATKKEPIEVGFFEEIPQ